MSSKYHHDPVDVEKQKTAHAAVKAGHNSTSPSVQVLRDRVKVLEEALAMVKSE